jgi:hypothetical protein
MKPDDFEQRLRQQPLRQVPPGWRVEILTTSMQTAGYRPSPLASRQTSWWRELLWPSPWAWTGAAAAWVLIFTLNFAAAAGSDGVFMANARFLPASVVEMALAERQSLMTSLLDSSPMEPAAPPRELVRPRPRSERKAEWSCA